MTSIFLVEIPNKPRNITSVLQSPFVLQWTDPVNINNFDLDYFEIEVSPVASSASINVWIQSETNSYITYLFDPEINELMSSLQSEVNVSISAMSKCLQRGQTAVITIIRNIDDDEITSTSMESSYSESDYEFVEPKNGIILILAISS